MVRGGKCLGDYDLNESLAALLAYTGTGLVTIGFGGLNLTSFGGFLADPYKDSMLLILSKFYNGYNFTTCNFFCEGCVC